MRRFAAAALAAGLLIALTACGGREETPVTRQIIAMDTAMQFTVYGETGNDTVQAAVEEVHRLEKLLDRTDPASEVSLLNQAGGEQAEVSEEVCGLMETAGAYTAATGGAFDITIAPVVGAWGFTEDTQKVPAQEKLDELLGYVGMGHVHVVENEVRLDPGTQIDLGGIAKGYASDRLTEIFLERRVKHGWFSLGGNVLAWGTRPDGAPWTVGIQDPKYPNQEMLVGIIGLENAFAVTSGGYQRYFEQNGRTYHHILDPATGYPAASGLTSVTVVADGKTAGNGAMCDALSTALFVMGPEKALDFWRNSGYDFDVILVTTDDRVLVTAGIAETFALEEGSGYAYEVVS